MNPQINVKSQKQEHCISTTIRKMHFQPIPINDALRHHLPPPTSLVLCQSASQPVTYFGQATPQVCFLDETAVTS